MNWRQTFNLHRLRWPALFALLAGLIAEVLLRSGALSPVDQRLQDLWFQWQGKRAEPRHVVIVALDEDTLAAYPDDPWMFWTDKFAVATARLRQAGAKVVGLDLLVSISRERWLGKLGKEFQRASRDHDRPFREELNEGHVVLAATHTDSGGREADYLLPSPDFLLALPDFDIPGHIGLADLFDEGTGIVRRYVIAPIPAAERAKLQGGVPVLSLPSLVVLRAAGLDPHAAVWTIGGHEVERDQAPTPIPYLGPPDTFKRLALKNLLGSGAISDAELAKIVRDKIVLIGPTAAGFNDDHFTPYATRFFFGRGKLMNGVEVHANVIESLVSGERLHPLGDAERIAGLALVAAVAALVFVAAPAWAGALVWLMGSVLFGWLGFIAFRAGHLVPVSVYSVATGMTLLGILGWRLTGEERERSRVRQMFGRYVSAQVVESLLMSGNRPELGGQSQAMTVLFSDIRNFTTISERLNAKEVVEMLNTYFARACAPLLAEGGSIDKFIGDAIMVEFGSPLPLADHALRAARAAVALRDVARDFAGWMQQRFPDRDLPAFAVGIGLHSGEAVIGNIGSPARMEFTAIGDTVNLASRLEGMTKELGCVILASEATVDAAGEALLRGRSETIRVKGREAPVKVFEILEVRSGGKASV